MEQRLSIVFFGRPGSGKGRISKFLGDMFNMRYIGTGSRFRKMLLDPKFAEEAALIKRGDRVCDEKVIEMVHTCFNTPDSQEDLSCDPNRVIWDGFPRSADQAKALDQLLDQNSFNYRMVIELQVPRYICVERIQRRAHESGRDEDKDPIAIAHRMDDYDGYAPATLDVLKGCMLYVPINAEPSLGIVQQSILAAVRPVIHDKCILS